MDNSKLESRRKFLKGSAAVLSGGAAVAGGLAGKARAQVGPTPETPGEIQRTQRQASEPGTLTVREIETGEITCPGGMPAFFARPAGGERRPAIVLMHERYGLVAHPRDLARRCAQEGFFALAPNFFFRHTDQAALNAGDSRYPMSDPEALELLEASFSALRTQDGADLEHTAVGGYCQTGRHPLVYAAEHPVSAVVVWYGAAAKREWEINETQPEALDDIIARLPCPLFGAFGSLDHIIAIEDVQVFREALERHRKSYEIHIYGGAPHGWLNNTMPGRYREAQAEAGWTAQQHFLESVFAGEWPQSGALWRFESEVPEDYDFSTNVRME